MENLKSNQKSLKKINPHSKVKFRNKKEKPTQSIVRFLVKLKDRPEPTHTGGVHNNPNLTLDRLQESESGGTERQDDQRATDLSRDLTGTSTVCNKQVTDEDL